jgi:hypothetical protein
MSKIVTSYDCPPIPVRHLDWSAVLDSYDGDPDSNHPIGFGATEAEAIANLIEWLEDEA